MFAGKLQAEIHIHICICMRVSVCVCVLKKYTICCASAINYEKQMIMQQTLKADLWLQLSPSLSLHLCVYVCVCN